MKKRFVDTSAILALLAELEQTLLEQLKRVQNERAELQAEIEQRSLDFGARKVNVDKKITIMQQELADEQRALHAINLSLEEFRRLQGRFQEPHRQALQRGRQQWVQRLQQMTSNVLVMCRAFNQKLQAQGAHPALAQQWKQFSKNVLYKAVADITEGKEEVLQELAEIREHMTRLNEQFQ